MFISLCSKVEEYEKSLGLGLGLDNSLIYITGA